MTFKEFFIENQKSILEKWIDAVFNTYPLDTVGFMRKQRDRFANPVGWHTEQGLTNLVELMAENPSSPELDMERAAPPLDDIVRIRAVQDFTPAGAVGFVVLLKKIVREMTKNFADGSSFFHELLQFESKLDSLTLLTFNIFSGCREQVFRNRVNEEKNKHARLLKRAKMICEVPAEEPDTPSTES